MLSAFRLVRSLTGLLVCCLMLSMSQGLAQAPSALPPTAVVQVPEPSVQKTITMKYRKNRYRGFYRGEVKNRAIRDAQGQLAPATEYATVMDLLKNLPPDSLMHKRYAAMRQSKGMWGWWTNQNRELRRKLAMRFPEEGRNVTVSGFLYAIKQMNDRDYHLVLMSAPDTQQIFRVMNVEISGLNCKSPDHELLMQARTQALAALGEDAGKKNWTIYYPSMPKIRVTGGLFFDGKKERTHMKPGYLRPVTAWEVHPIYSLELLTRLPSHIIQWE